MTVAAAFAISILRSFMLVAGAALTERAAHSPALRHKLWSFTLLVCCLSFAFPSGIGLVAVPLPSALDESYRIPRIHIAGDVQLPEQGAPPAELQAQIKPPIQYSVWLVWVWLAGALVVLIRTGASHWAIRRQIAKGSDRIGIIQNEVDAIREKLKLGSVRCALVDRDAIPAIAGTFRPTIVLPRDCKSWKPDRRQVVLLHELMHVKRRDAIVDRLAELTCIIHWFNPAVWYAVRRMRVTRELACDADVVKQGVPARSYAAHLLALVKDLQSSHHHSALGVGSHASLPARVDALLRPANGRAGYARLPWLLIAVVTALCCGLAVTSTSVPDGPQIKRIARYLDHKKLGADDYVRERTTWAVAQASGGHIVEPLVEQLRANDWRARSYAAWALALTQDSRATQALIVALRDPHWRVRGHASFALDEIGDPRALNAMRDALNDEAWQVRIDAVEFIAKHGGEEALGILRRLTSDDPHPLVRKEAAQELRARRG